MTQEVRTDKLKACPWCGWKVPVLVVEITPQSAKKHRQFYIQCRRCGVSGKTSSHRWLAIWRWNHKTKVKRPKTQHKRYHIYGREF